MSESQTTPTAESPESLAQTLFEEYGFHTSGSTIMGSSGTRYQVATHIPNDESLETLNDIVGTLESNGYEIKTQKNISETESTMIKARAGER